MYVCTLLVDNICTTLLYSAALCHTHFEFRYSYCYVIVYHKVCLPCSCQYVNLLTLTVCSILRPSRYNSDHIILTKMNVYYSSQRPLCDKRRIFVYDPFCFSVVGVRLYMWLLRTFVHVSLGNKKSKNCSN